ncbi:Uncharacterized protein BM_BM14274 [Brugia malayi]|uniref:Bm14274 n=1 Tax=Brugia malayi TaxID=6279 RepID=A0A0K0J0Q3_BRUMA|nr:Uncharacterized protein BM_BM14274 [Brugia malayi]CDP99989.1 Bm14274 [Brugia malayi]VIO91586.1 Uncharacterized protein BM_BM14274 [Brugia malayi]
MPQKSCLANDELKVPCCTDFDNNQNADDDDHANDMMTVQQRS